MNIARARERDLRRAGAQRLEKAKIIRVLRPVPGNAADNPWDAPRHAVAMALRTGPAVLFSHFDLDAGNAGAGECIGIAAAAELAIGDDLQADLFLQLDHAGNRGILDCRECLMIELAGRVLLACAQQFRRPHQAADMFGAEGGRADHSRAPPRYEDRCVSAIMDVSASSAAGGLCPLVSCRAVDLVIVSRESCPLFRQSEKTNAPAHAVARTAGALGPSFRTGARRGLSDAAGEDHLGFSPG